MNNIPLNKPKVEYRHPAQMKGAPFEPMRRLLEDSSFRDLLTSIRRVGIWSPLQITPEDAIMDGHRRHAAATILKMIEVPVIVNPLGLQLGFASLNIASKPIAGQQWLDAHARGLDLVHVREKEARNIKDLEAWVHEDGIERLAAMGVSPEIAVTVRRLGKYVEWNDGADLARILWWLLDFNMQRPVIDALKARPRTPAVVFADAIRKRRPLQQFWGVAVTDDSDEDDSDEDDNP